jgi:hypothetical protein
MKLKFAFVGINEPSSLEYKAAANEGVDLVYIGYAGVVDGRVQIADVEARGEFDGVATSNVSTALRLQPAYHIGVFERRDRGRVVFEIYRRSQ